MGWKMAIGGAVTAVVGVLLLGSGGRDSAWLGFALLLAGVLSVTVGLLLHIDRRMREIAGQLSQLQAEMRAMKETTRGQDAEDN